MARIALGVEYVGTNYSGWQRHPKQEHVPSIQAEVERAIASVANHPISIICAGRTDAGVHASGQVVHCDVSAVRNPYAWVNGCNRYLPDDVRVLWMQEVADNFSARRSATSRQYKYVIYNNPLRPSLLRDYVAWYYSPLNIDLMIQAGQCWLGSHDFSSFRGAGCQSKSPVREVKMITIERRGEMVIIDILANAFLYHMVRNMVGVLLQIGSSKVSNSSALEMAQSVLHAKCRTKAGITAPPQGLYLTDVSYPEEFQIPQQRSDLWFFNQG